LVPIRIELLSTGATQKNEILINEKDCGYGLVWFRAALQRLEAKVGEAELPRTSRMLNESR
jgi:hypothetical protein